MLAKITKNLHWIIVAAVIFPTIKYAFENLTRTDFLDGFIAELLSMLMGLILGIPIALEINRRQQQTIESGAEEQSRKDEFERTKKILSLVKKELEHNKNAVMARYREENGIKKRVVLDGPLKDDLWNAFSDSGELHWIKDLDLLDGIAYAYHTIRIVIFLEQQYFDIVYFPGMRGVSQEQLVKTFEENFTLTDRKVLEALDIALSAIDQNLT